MGGLKEVGRWSLHSSCGLIWERDLLVTRPATLNAENRMKPPQEYKYKKYKEIQGLGGYEEPFYGETKEQSLRYQQVVRPPAL